jgi:hypothetical protein
VTFSGVIVPPLLRVDRRPPHHIAIKGLRSSWNRVKLISQKDNVPDSCNKWRRSLYHYQQQTTQKEQKMCPKPPLKILFHASISSHSCSPTPHRHCSGVDYPLPCTQDQPSQTKKLDVLFVPQIKKLGVLERFTLTLVAVAQSSAQASFVAGVNAGPRHLSKLVSRAAPTTGKCASTTPYLPWRVAVALRAATAVSALLRSAMSSLSRSPNIFSWTERLQEREQESC